MAAHQQAQNQSAKERAMILRQELYRAEFFVLLLLAEPIADDFLSRVGVRANEVRTQLEIGVVGRAAHLSKTKGHDLTSMTSDGLSDILKLATEECDGQSLDARHLLIGAFRNEDNAFSKCLAEKGVTLDAMRKALRP